MNEKNFEYLRDQVKYTGFGEELEGKLKENLAKQPPEFTLQHQTKFGKDELNSSLHFKKSTTSDLYFFNNYLASLKQDQSTEKVNQAFYINKENNITLKEGYNLMSGRAVNKDLTTKEGQVYNAWVQMDFKQTESNGNFKLKQYHQNYGFDLEKELSKHPIKELASNLDKSRLVESLQKGNRQSVTFVENGAEQKRYIEANPQFKSITVYDSNMQKQSIRHAQTEKQTQSQEVTAEKKTKQEIKSQAPGDPDGKDGSAKKTKKGKEMAISQ